MLGLHTSIGMKLNFSEITFGREKGHIIKHPIQIKKV